MFKSSNDLYFVYACFMVSFFALTTTPFFSGFYSKEFILHASFSAFNWTRYVAFFMLNLSALTTLIYSTKILYFLFSSDSSKVIYNSIYLNKKKFKLLDYFFLFVQLTCVVLLFYSTFSGYLGFVVNSYWFIFLSAEYYDYFLTDA